MWILTRLNDADGELMFWGNERKGGVVVGLDRCMMCLHTIHFGVGQKVYNLQHNNPELTSLTILAAPLFSSEASSDSSSFEPLTNLLIRNFFSRPPAELSPCDHYFDMRFDGGILFVILHW